MKKIYLTLLLSLLLGSCSQETSSGSYAMILVVNGTEYNGTEAQLADYQAGKVIGKVTEEVAPDVLPSNNQSNFFEKGTVIFSVKNETEFVIVEDPAGERHLLQRAPGNDAN
ncbi:hypothetical protein [Planococcus chinensis]|uniref:DUF3221 domain-containing protein n=1 Tax=Planococcus chinensis TaxID=272917 RepID=A0ABW4QMC2_9BACL